MMEISTLLSDVVIPEVALVFESGAVRSICVEFRENEVGFSATQDVFELVLLAGAARERFELSVWESETMQNWPLSRVRDRLHHELVDFVAESSFGWGQQH